MREVHAAEEVLEARVGAEAVPSRIITEINHLDCGKESDNDARSILGLRSEGALSLASSPPRAPPLQFLNSP